ncbi:MAG: hypothetical protein WCJ30_00175 [Deltaproteobacteria bacterium]
MKHSPSQVLVLGLAMLLASVCTQGSAFAQAAPPTERATIHPIDPAEVSALRPLLPRGAVIVLRALEPGLDPCCTVYVRAHAPLDVVRHAIVTPEEYPTFMPALTGVDILSRRGHRVAFRFRVHAVFFAVAADASLQVINDHRVDFSIAQSDVGPSQSRWELFSDGPEYTIIAYTVWSDPSRGSWAVRQLVGGDGSGASSASASIPVATALTLGVRRRAEDATGHAQRVRPVHFAVAPSALTPPEPGPWLDLLTHTNIAVLTLGPDGSLEQITVAGAAAGRAPEDFVRRLMTPEHYGRGLPWMRDATVVSRSTDSVQFRLHLGAPLAGSQGEIRGHVDPGGRAMHFVGGSGDFAGDLHRWDFVPYSLGTYLLYTAGADERHAPWPQRSFLDLDAWGAAGVLAYWDIITIRLTFVGPD